MCASAGTQEGRAEWFLKTNSWPCGGCDGGPTMKQLIENLIARGWNRLNAGPGVQENSPGLVLGYSLVDGQLTRSRTGISHVKRTEHCAILGKTGTGKSSLLRFM